MVGKGVLLECLRDPAVTEVVAIGRHPTGVLDAKLKDVVQTDVTDFSADESRVSGFDACFFCLGVSAIGLSEEEYRDLTYGLTLRAAKNLRRLNPRLTFIYVSGQGTDATEKGRTMWARVKGKTENDLLALGFHDAYMFRPGVIEAMDGIRSRTRAYRFLYVALWPVWKGMKLLSPGSVTSTRKVGRAMINVARHGYPKKILDSKDINRAAEPAPSS